MWIPLFACAFALVANMIVQLLAYRATQRYMRSIFVGFGAGLLVLSAVELLRFSATPANPLEIAILLVGDLGIFGCLSFLFFNFINAGESAIRVRILRELREARGSTTEAALLANYNDRVILDARLGRMVRNGQIELVDGHYRIVSPTLVWMAEFFLLFKRVLLRRSSEFSE